MKGYKLLGISWLILAICNLYFGIYDLFKYSNPSADFFLMVPASVTLSKIYIGALSLYAGLSILYRKSSYRLLIPFLAVISLFYIICDLFTHGVEFVSFSGINLITLGLAVYSIKVSRKSIKFTSITITTLVLLIILGLIPYIFANSIDYELFNYLHNTNNLPN